MSTNSSDDKFENPSHTTIIDETTKPDLTSKNLFKRNRITSLIILPLVILIATILVILYLIAIFNSGTATDIQKQNSWKAIAMLVVGIFIGITLVHSSFGFGGQYRKMFVKKDFTGFQAQIVMMFVCSIMMGIILLLDYYFEWKTFFSMDAPISTSLVLGSFIFGIGMQLGGGCASGTLYDAGTGTLLSFYTLFMFIMSASISTYLMDLTAAANLVAKPINLLKLFDRSSNVYLAPVMMIVHLMILAIVWVLLAGLGRYTKQKQEMSINQEQENSSGKEESTPLITDEVKYSNMIKQALTRVITGPWNPYVGGILLAFSNVAILLISNSPWGITGPLTLWGCKFMYYLGWKSIPEWDFWKGKNFHAPIYFDLKSWSNIGIIFGGCIGACFAQRYYSNLVAVVPKKTPKYRYLILNILSRTIGGLMLGVGARMAYGCNIGSGFSGVSSFSLHGYIWILCAAIGNFVGIKLRPLFGLAV